ncbi:putative DD34D transposase [Trichonephila clavipes]|nr:putative DD34D transposase [Trichonephila clavipes]
MEVNKENIQYILQFFYDKDENSSQEAEIVNGVYGADTIPKNLHILVSHQLTLKNMMDRISICEALAKRNEITPVLKRIMTGDEKWLACDNTVLKRSWSKRGEAA